MQAAANGPLLPIYYRSSTKSYRYDASTVEEGGEIPYQTWVRVQHDISTDGYLLVIVNEEEKAIYFANERDLQGLAAAGLATAHNTHWTGRTVAAQERAVARSLQIAQTTALLMADTAALATLDNWWDTTIKDLQEEGCAVFYYGKNCPADAAYSGPVQFDAQQCIHICKRFYEYPLGNKCLSLTQDTQDNSDATGRLRSAFPRTSGTCNSRFNLPANRFRSKKMKALLQHHHALIAAPYIAQVIDNYYNEKAVRLGPDPLLGIAFRGGNFPGFPNFRNVQWPSWDGQTHLSDDCEVYVTCAP
jgi:hypothetical protein